MKEKMNYIISGIANVNGKDMNFEFDFVSNSPLTLSELLQNHVVTSRTLKKMPMVKSVGGFRFIDIKELPVNNAKVNTEEEARHVAADYALRKDVDSERSREYAIQWFNTGNGFERTIDMLEGVLRNRFGLYY